MLVTGCGKPKSIPVLIAIAFKFVLSEPKVSQRVVTTEDFCNMLNIIDFLLILFHNFLNHEQRQLVKI
jgi:hypothetical protein